MALCVNQSGTWREISTQCVNDSGTWRNVATGCINQSGTWREFGFFNIGDCPLGSNVEGGYLICKFSGIAWVVAPSSAEVSRNWYSRSDAITTAQSVSGCTGWFVPSLCDLRTGYFCRTYWDSYCAVAYWSNSQNSNIEAWNVRFTTGNFTDSLKTRSCCVRAFRCVTY